MAELRVTELDFEAIKANLKTFLKAQDELTDYNFEGSALNVLLDILAYNTHYNAILAHLNANEMFIDSAVKRNSVVSIAKTLGYMPTSARAARANVSVTITPPGAYTDTTLDITRDTIFSASLNNTSYTFYPKEGYTADRSSLTNNTTGFFFEDIELIEGRRVLHQFIVTSDILSGPFLLPNANLDTTTLRVRVQESTTTDTLVTWNYSDSALGVAGDDTSFFVEESSTGQYQIVFGDNIIGKQLSVGNVVYVDYITSHGIDGNYASSFTILQTLSGSTEQKAIATLSNSYGGVARETLDGIRYNAPRFNATKNRAVTAQDYKTLISARFPNVNSISVWGGEDNDPPIYGKVFVCLEAATGSIITQDDKDIITTEVLGPRSVVSIQTEFADPEYTYIGVNATVKYDAKTTSTTSMQMSSAIKTNIQSFFSTNLSKLRKNFYYSQMTGQIFDISPAIISVSSEIRLHKRWTGLESTTRDTDISGNFNAEIRPGTLRSSIAILTIGGVDYESYLVDDSAGTLVVKSVSDDSTISSDFGTIDYTTGVVYIPSALIPSLGGDAPNFRIYVTPSKESADILSSVIRTATVSTAAVRPTVSRNIVLKLDTTTSDATYGYETGLAVTSYPQIQDQ